jgi:hypothetical protein
MSRARVYCDVNETRPREYWDYETLNVAWGYVLLSCCLRGPLRPARSPSRIFPLEGGDAACWRRFWCPWAPEGAAPLLC